MSNHILNEVYINITMDHKDFLSELVEDIYGFKNSNIIPFNEQEEDEEEMNIDSQDEPSSYSSTDYSSSSGGYGSYGGYGNEESEKSEDEMIDELDGFVKMRILLNIYNHLVRIDEFLNTLVHKSFKKIKTNIDEALDILDMIIIPNLEAYENKLGVIIKSFTRFIYFIIKKIKEFYNKLNSQGYVLNRV